MTRPAALGALLLLFLTGIGCSSVRTDTQADPDFDFSACRTWSFLPVTVKVGGSPPNDLIRKRAEAVVAEELGKKGFTRVEEGGDLRIILHGNVREKVQVTDWGYRYGGYGWRYGAAYRDVTVDQYEEGTLFLDVVSGSTKELVWRGRGVAVAGDMEENARKAEEAVRLLLAEFPPPPASRR
jgi:hypothetical protein